MVNESNKIIVKVGKKSRIRFANSKVYRAITANDLSVLTTKHNDCQIVIIENISEDEQDTVRDFAKSFKEQREGNTVLFYIPDNEDVITSGVADELDYNIYLTDRDLYKHLYSNYGINVSVYLDDRKRLNSQDLSGNLPEGITDVFGDISNDDINSAIAAIDEEDSKKASIHSEEKQDAAGENSDSSIENVSVSEEDKSNTEEKVEIVENIHDIFGTDNFCEKDSVSPSKVSESAGNKESNTDKKDKHSEEVNVSVEEKSEAADNILEKHNEKPSEAISEDTADYIEKLKMQVRDAKYDYNEAVKDMREANARIASLEDIIRLLKEEKEAMEKRFNELVISDEVLEDPISLAEYSVIKENADKLEGQVLELNHTISNLKETIETRELDINSAETSIEELKETIESLKAQLADANKSIESGEAFKEQLDEYERKLKRASEEKTKTESRLAVVEEDNERLQSNISDITLRVDEEAATRIELTSLLSKSIIKIKELSNKLVSLENDKNLLLTKLKNTESQLKSSKELTKEHLAAIAKLEKSVNDNDKRMELASNSSASEISQLKDKISQLETKLGVTEQQLERKENQYNNLVATSGMDENGATALLETNRTLENISKTLREQLSSANKELDKARRKENETSKQLSSYKAQVSTLQKSLQSLASAGAGSSANVAVRQLNIGYSHSQIVTVFGSGSFGITTTAMSLAQKLSVTSKVLYIDFDLVSPMADSWFKINPMISNIPGTMNGSIHNSGLGLFIEHGVGIISQYMNNIIKVVSKTKGGGLHYLSGLYYRPDSYKLATANYDELFTLLCNNFQYIVVDFGRLGSSEIGDQLIKVISDIAYRNIVVTTANQFEVRNFKSKLTGLNIKMESIAWLFNMCTTSAIDAKIKDSISPCKYDLLPRMEQYGAQENFLRASLTRDRFGLFVDRTVFGR